jgi:hypothetical protein
MPDLLSRGCFLGGSAAVLASVDAGNKTAVPVRKCSP